MKKCGFEAGLNPKRVETLLVCSRDFVGVVLRARFILIVRLNGPDPSLILLWPGTNSSTISSPSSLERAGEPCAEGITGYKWPIAITILQAGPAR